MKKIYMILIPILLLSLTGCFEKTKTLTCTRDNETTNNVLISSTVNVEYDGDKLINFKLETVTDLSKSNLLNDEFVDSLIRTSKDTSSKYEGKSGIEANYEKVDVGVKYTLKVVFDELKDEEIKDFDPKLYNKTMKLDELKSGYLKDWKCEG